VRGAGCEAPGGVGRAGCGGIQSLPRQEVPVAVVGPGLSRVGVSRVRLGHGLVAAAARALLKRTKPRPSILAARYIGRAYVWWRHIGLRVLLECVIHRLP